MGGSERIYLTNAGAKARVREEMSTGDYIYCLVAKSTRDETPTLYHIYLADLPLGRIENQH